MTRPFCVTNRAVIQTDPAVIIIVFVIITVITVIHETSNFQRIEMSQKQKKHPCGACSESVTSATKSLMCTVCELWFHYDCIEGMTMQLFDCCNLAYTTLGVSSFFCKCCKKATAKLNGIIKELRNEVQKLSKRVEKLEVTW